MEADPLGESEAEGESEALLLELAEREGDELALADALLLADAEGD